ncbi:contractile injection system tape measure protein [Chitinophaga solisilvae]|uniref:contractile injection system tape measure protein n=1 Tax=Chitinophaga solisilvae TaxID=1233460 RepID=UPI001371CE04|nr:contractile injection system tape measure protein [Chitinophaga solisilvae]
MNRHLIHQQFVELSLSDSSAFHAVAEKFSDMLSRSALPLLSDNLDRLAGEEEMITLQKVEVDMGVIRWEEEQHLLADRLVALLLKALQDLLPAQPYGQAPGDENVMRTSPAMRHWQSWSLYLQTGTLPWHALPVPSVSWWEEVLLQALEGPHRTSIIRIIREVLTTAPAVRRLTTVFTPEFITKITTAAAVLSETDIQLSVLLGSLIHRLRASDAAIRLMWQQLLINEFSFPSLSPRLVQLLDLLIRQFPGEHWIEQLSAWILIMHTGMNGQTSLVCPLPVVSLVQALQVAAVKGPAVLSGLQDNAVKQLLSRLSEQSLAILLQQRENVNDNVMEYTNNEPVPHAAAESPLAPEITPVPGDDNGLEYTPDETAAVYIPDAGLVIVAAFLPALFEALEYTADGQFRSAAQQWRAVMLTAFLANAKPCTPDWELTMAKILCGLPPAAIIPEIILTETELEEGLAMLRAAISYWQAIGNTTEDGLREGFLLRNGKLTGKNGEWLLLTEAQAIDLLLEKLPWGIGMIQHPWMPWLLRTEWPGII